MRYPISKSKGGNSRGKLSEFSSVVLWSLYFTLIFRGCSDVSYPWDFPSFFIFSLSGLPWDSADKEWWRLWHEPFLNPLWVGLLYLSYFLLWIFIYSLYSIVRHHRFQKRHGLCFQDISWDLSEDDLWLWKFSSEPGAVSISLCSVWYYAHLASSILLPLFFFLNHFVGA